MPMLNYAGAKAQSQGIGNLVFVHGDAHDLPFYDNEFDVVSCCGALHLFCDLPKALSEVYRVLVPGGRFIAGAGRWPWQGKFGRRSRNWYHRRTGVKGFFREELELSLKGAGLINVVSHYEERSWLIMSALKQ
jgi:ubiquinone/menaquinone biosynthesis C-methylase UbiE